MIIRLPRQRISSSSSSSKRGESQQL